MRRAFLIIFFMFMLNSVTILVNGLPIWGDTVLITPYNASQVEDALDPWDLSDSWDPIESGGLFGDIKAGLEALNKLRSFTQAFPDVLASFEIIPALWIAWFGTIWGITWWLGILDLILGGKIFG